MRDRQLIDSREASSKIYLDRSSARVENCQYRNGGLIPRGSKVLLDSARLGR